MSTFDDFYNDMESGADKQPIRPLYAINYKDKKQLHKWIKDTFYALMEDNKDRIREVSENYKLYKGNVSNSSLSGRRGEGYNTYKINIKDEELFVNYMKQLTDEQVNKINEVKPAIDVVPVHNEHNDKVAAKIAKSIIDTRFYEDNFDKILRKVTRRSKIAGEDYLHIYWNPDKGDLHPAYKEAQSEGRKLPLLDDNGQQMKDDDGKPMYVEQEVRIGEVDYELVDTRHMLPEPVDSWEDAKWVIRLKREYVHDLRVMYPKMAKEIKVIDADHVSINGMTNKHLRGMQQKDQTLVLYLYHKKDKNMHGGYFAKATLDCVLECGKMKDDHGKLPFIKRSDKELEDEQHAQSFMHDVKALQAQHIDLTSMMLRNIKLCSHPKWFAEQGSVSIQSLGSGRTIVQTRPGAKQPILSAPPTIPGDVFNFRDTLKMDMRSLGTGAVNEPGQPPPGITAGVALQFLNEQENKRYNTDMAGHFDFIKEGSTMTLQIAAQYYDEADGRFLRILGKNNEHTAMSFKQVDLNRPYDIRLTHTTGLPETKSAKIQTILDLAGNFEGLFSKEQLVDLLELGDTNKMYDQATAAVKSAESTLEDLLQGNPVMEPQPYENLIVAWKVFVAEIQKRSFKEKVPENIRQDILDYINALEYMMVEKANINPTFGAELSQLSLFPVQFEIPKPEPIDPMMMSGEEGAPGSQPLVDAGASDGSEAASPQEEVMMNQRADAGQPQG